jgi:5-methylcytosine-specific restriction protein A
MPRRAPSICTYPGCGQTTKGKGRCPKHAGTRNKEIDARRRGARQRGYDRRWQKARAAYLRENPLCVKCLDETPPRDELATVVDHIIDHKGDQELFWDRNNWQSLCKRHHDSKTWHTHHGGREGGSKV